MERYCLSVAEYSQKVFTWCIFLQLQFVYSCTLNISEILFSVLNTGIWSYEHDIAQWRMCDEVANVFATWDTDDQLPSDEEDGVLQLSPFISPAASTAFLRDGVVMKLNQIMKVLVPQTHKMQLLVM